MKNGKYRVAQKIKRGRKVQHVETLSTKPPVEQSNGKHHNAGRGRKIK